MPTEQRHVRSFRNGRNQAARISVEIELPGTEAVIKREGEELVVVPVHRRGLSALLDSWEPLIEALPEIGDAPTQAEDIF